MIEKWSAEKEAREKNATYDAMKNKANDELQSFLEKNIPKDFNPETEVGLIEIPIDLYDEFMELREYERTNLGMKEDSAWLKERMMVVDDLMDKSIGLKSD